MFHIRTEGFCSIVAVDHKNWQPMIKLKFKKKEKNWNFEKKKGIEKIKIVDLHDQ